MAKEHAFIVPVFNGERHIAACIESLLAQGSRSDIVVVDDGSTDGSKAVLDTYQDRITIIHQQNAGVSAARNEGVRYTEAELLTFIDQDDWLAPEFVNEMLASLEGVPSAVAAFTGARVMVESSGGLVEGPVLSYEHASPNTFDWLLRYCFVSPGCLVLRREAFLAAGGFDPSLSNVGEDLDLWFKLSRMGEFVRQEGALFYWREHALGNSRKVLAIYRGTRRVMDRHLLKSGLPASTLRSCYRHHRVFFAAMLRHGMKAEAREGRLWGALSQGIRTLIGAPALLPHFLRVPLRK